MEDIYTQPWELESLLRGKRFENLGAGKAGEGSLFCPATKYRELPPYHGGLSSILFLKT